MNWHIKHLFSKYSTRYLLTVISESEIPLLEKNSTPKNKPKKQVGFRGKSVRSWRDGSSGRLLMVDTLSYFSFQPWLM